MNSCERLHRIVSVLRLHTYPFSTEALPPNGIILMYERGQLWAHGGDEPRTVHVGTHRDGNLAHRLAEHFLLDERKMNFTTNGAAPKDRSILRKTIGRAILKKASDPYIAMWDIDFTTLRNRERYGASRELGKEKATEETVTDYIRSRLSFRVVPVAQHAAREFLKARIIASLAQCDLCCPTKDWLGCHAPDERVGQSGLWQVQHTEGTPLSDEDFEMLSLGAHQ